MWDIHHGIADWDCFRILILLGDLKDSKSTSGGGGWGSTYLRKSNVRSHLLDVQETNFSFTQLY